MKHEASLAPTKVPRPGEDTQRPKILAAALDEATAVGFSHITRDNVAARAGVTSSLIHHYFGGMADFRHEVMLEAARVQRLDVLAQGLTARHPVAMDLPPAVRERVAASLATN